MTHQLKFNAVYLFSPCSTNIEILQNFKGTNLPFQESIVTRNEQKSCKVHYFEVRLHYYFFKWDVA